jgi:hypothetical protein
MVADLGALELLACSPQQTRPAGKEKANSMEVVEMEWRRIEVQQLDRDGNVYRVFTYHARARDVEDKLGVIGRAFNMSATCVVVR